MARNVTAAVLGLPAITRRHTAGAAAILAETARGSSFLESVRWHIRDLPQTLQVTSPHG